MHNVISGKPLDTLVGGYHVGNESFDSIYQEATNIAKGFTNFFKPDMFTEVGERISSLLVPSSKSELVGVDSNISLWLSRTNYIKLSAVQVYRPVGLTVSYAEYLDELEQAFDFVEDINDELLGTVEGTLMNYLNNPSMLTASAVPRSKNKYFVQSIETFAEPIGKCFDAHSKSDKYQYNEAFRRNADYNDACQRMNRLGSRVKAANLSAIKNKTTNIFKMVDQLAEQIRKIDHYKQMTRPVATRLGEDISTCAKWVEFYGVLLRQIHVLEVAMDDTNKHLKKLTSNNNFA